MEAVPFLESLLGHFPDHVKGLILLGDINTNHVRDYASAERCYRRIIEIDPGHVQGGGVVDSMEPLNSIHTMCGVRSVVIFCAAFFKCSTGCMLG